MFDLIQSCFTIELLAAAFLCAGHLPMRGRARSFVPPLALLLILLSALRLGGRSLIDYGYAGGLVHYLAVLLLVSALVWLCFESAAQEALLCGVAGYAMQHCGHDIVMLVLAALGRDGGDARYAAIRLGIMLVVYAVLYRLFARKFRPDREKIRGGRRWVILSPSGRYIPPRYR